MATKTRQQLLKEIRELKAENFKLKLDVESLEHSLQTEIEYQCGADI